MTPLRWLLTILFLLGYGIMGQSTQAVGLYRPVKHNSAVGSLHPTTQPHATTHSGGNDKIPKAELSPAKKKIIEN
jgi:hypothetical protein